MKIQHQRAHSKANASLISMVQRFSDISIIFFGGFVASKINGFNFNYESILVALIALVAFQMIGGITDFYRSWRGGKFSSELRLILKNWTLSIIVTAGITSFMPSSSFTFEVFLYWYISVCLGFTFCRSAIRFLVGTIRNLGYNNRKVAVAGSMPIGVRLLKNFKEEPWLGFIVEGIYDDVQSHNDNEIKYCGDLDKLVEDARQGRLDYVYIAMKMSEEHKFKKILGQLTNTTCSVMFIPDVFTFNILQSRTEEVNGVPVVPLFDTPLNGINKVFKRAEDIILSMLILMFISPVLALIAFAVKFTSQGPVIFRQTRYGMDGKPIMVWKFRSMTVMENNDVVIQAKKGDARVTKVGAFLRRTSLDELPQFFNVLIGGMSIVGPRPHAVAHNEQYRNLIEGYMLRHKVKPGITGWAQINGWRGETDTLDKMQKRVEYDLEYIRDWSLWLDLKIIFLTVFKGFIHKSAY
ncbi:undecaprenyl-phosphate glucose phosphotransferase [Serratia sp. IR-2025]